jgi:hypothetical protein
MSYPIEDNRRNCDIDIECDVLHYPLTRARLSKQLVEQRVAQKNRTNQVMKTIFDLIFLTSNLLKLIEYITQTHLLKRAFASLVIPLAF